MFARSLRRAAAQAAVAKKPAEIPSCLAAHGHEFSFHYLSHPGVMAISQLLEMRGIVRVRASFTQENIDAMKVVTIKLCKRE